MSTPLRAPKGDSHGSLGETVLARELQAQPLQSLRQRQLSLLVLCAGALIILIDASVVNVALPSIKHDLGFSQANLAWVVNGYLIPFGGLLLLGGKLGSRLGSKRVFVGGLALFSVATLVCGLSVNEGMLISARFAQGAGGALGTSVVLAMIVDMFPEPLDQVKALAFFAFVASSGAALGLMAGAVLTDALSWRWVFFVNVPLGIVTVLSARRILPLIRSPRSEPLDILGTVLVVAALMLGVYTLVQTVDHGWSSARTLALGGTSVLLLGLFVVAQARVAHPLVPRGLIRARNVAWPNVVLGLLVVGPTGFFFLASLYMRQVLGYTPLQVGLAFLPVAVVLAVVTLKLAPRLFKHVDPRSVLLAGLAVMAAGLALLSRLPADGSYAADLLPGMLLLGGGAGLAVPSALNIVLAGATRHDSAIRSGLTNTTQQLGAALGLAVLASVASNHTALQLRRGASPAHALTSGYGLAFLVAAGILAGALAVSWLTVKAAVPDTAPTELDPTRRGVIQQENDATGAVNPDFLALGLSGTNMMAMLWSIAHGRRAVGVEMRGDPSAAQMHWNIREDAYHHLAVIDQMMLERYGAGRLPRLGDGSLFKLHECFFDTDPASAADARADEVLTGFIPDSHIAGLVEESVHIDDRPVNGRPARTLTKLGPAPRPAGPSTAKIGRPLAEVLAEPSAFQVGAQELLLVMRRYLRALERLDLAAGEPPRCRIFTYHRVVVPGRRLGARGSLRRRFTNESDGFVTERDGRTRVRIEAVVELDGKRSYRRVRAPGTKVLDLGVPELFMIAEGVQSSDAARLGFRQEPLLIDHMDGRGPVRAEADYLAGVMTIYVDSQRRSRISTETDRDGNEYWVRQVMIGHEDDAEVAWIIVEVPEFRTFDPILAGIASPDAPIDSAEYFGGFQHLVQQYFLDHATVLTGLPRFEVARMSMAARPVLITVRAGMGRDALITPNGVVAGDTFGNGDFLTSGGINTGMIGHAFRVRQYWQDRDRGVEAAEAIATLAGSVKGDTSAWLAQTAEQFRQPAAATPVQGVTPAGARRQAAIEATRRLRRSVDPIPYNDVWSRITLFVGRLHSYPLPELPDEPVNIADMPADMPPAVAAALGLSLEPFTWPARKESEPGSEPAAEPVLTAEMAMDGDPAMDGDRAIAGDRAMDGDPATATADEPPMPDDMPLEVAELR
jgi:EmrB/QacA subfamily drug resistance transporter